MKTSTSKTGIIILTMLAFMLTFAEAKAQVVCDNNAVCAALGVNTTTLTVSSVTVPANDNVVLVVLVRGGANQNATNVTFNSQNLARLGSVFSYLAARAEIWYLALGNVSSPISSNVSITYTSTTPIAGATAISFHNVNQTTPLNNLTGIGFDHLAGSTSVSVPGNSGDMAVEAVSCVGPSAGSPPVFTHTGSQTEFTSCSAPSGNSLRHSSAYIAQTGSPSTLSWNVSNLNSTDNGIQIAANIIRCTTGTWRGTVSTDWFNTANWACGLVPTTTTDVTIPPNGGTVLFQPVIGSGTANVHNLNVNVSANLTISNGATLNINGGGIVTTNGTLTNNGTFNQ